ncbi:hypothetical protein Btru_051579 [Bulinus truncatus]|nr:hypothetical protein Btru_051579 [Bulinus truncatus]
MDELNNATYKNTTEYVQQYLSMLQHQSTIAFIPTLVYMCLVSVTGCVGNCLVIFVHYKKMTRTPLKMLIISMAVFDLLIDVIVIPGGTFYLTAGDVIRVAIDGYGLVYFRQQSSFAGLMMLGTGSSDSSSSVQLKCKKRTVSNKTNHTNGQHHPRSSTEDTVTFPCTSAVE